MSGELDFLVNRIVAPDEPPDKSNHDDLRRGHGCGLFGAVGRRNGIRYQETQS
jgi:hypothetical protein